MRPAKTRTGTGEREASGERPTGGGKQRRSFRWMRRLIVAGVVAIAAIVVVANIFVHQRGHDHVFTRQQDIAKWADEQDAPVDAVIVPGAALFVLGKPSRAVGKRVDAAVSLYSDGIVDHVLVSGDNSRKDYDEPTGMRRLVHLAGVPLADITVDYAGFSTWDTCRRGKEIFGVQRAVFVTQTRYADRAAALCRAAGLDAVVYAQPTGRPPTLQRSVWDRVRERLAAVKATYEILVSPDPTYLGPFVGLPGSEDPANPDPALGES